MKKLLALLVATFAIGLNAATVSWSVDYTYKPGTTDYAEGYLIYFFDNSTYAQTSAVSDVADADLSFLTKGFAADVTDDEGYTGADGIGNYGNSSQIDGYLVILNADNVSDATLAYVSSIESGSTSAAGLPANISFGDLTATQNSDNWKAVPEPTSGLLMLIGIAGLALRRRRA